MIVVDVRFLPSINIVDHHTVEEDRDEARLSSLFRESWRLVERLKMYQHNSAAKTTVC